MVGGWRNKRRLPAPEHRAGASVMPAIFMVGSFAAAADHHLFVDFVATNFADDLLERLRDIRIQELDADDSGQHALVVEFESSLHGLRWHVFAQLGPRLSHSDPPVLDENMQAPVGANVGQTLNLPSDPLGEQFGGLTWVAS